MPGTPAFNMKLDIKAATELLYSIQEEKSKTGRDTDIQYKMRHPKLTIVKLWSKIRIVPPERNLVFFL